MAQVQMRWLDCRDKRAVGMIAMDAMDGKYTAKEAAAGNCRRFYGMLRKNIFGMLGVCERWYYVPKHGIISVRFDTFEDLFEPPS